MDDNWRTSIGYICIASVFITMYLGAAWVMSPQEFTFKIEMDNNTKESFESIEYGVMNRLTDIYGLNNLTKGSYLILDYDNKTGSQAYYVMNDALGEQDE